MRMPRLRLFRAAAMEHKDKHLVVRLSVGRKPGK